MPDEWRIADAATGNLDGSDFQRLFIDTNVDLAPETAFRATVLAGIPLAFTLRLDAGAVDQQVQRPLSSLDREWTRPTSSGACSAC